MKAKFEDIERLVQGLIESQNEVSRTLHVKYSPTNKGNVSVSSISGGTEYCNSIPISISGGASGTRDSGDGKSLVVKGTRQKSSNGGLTKWELSIGSGSGTRTSSNGLCTINKIPITDEKYDHSQMPCYNDPDPYDYEHERPQDFKPTEEEGGDPDSSNIPDPDPQERKVCYLGVELAQTGENACKKGYAGFCSAYQQVFAGSSHIHICPSGRHIYMCMDRGEGYPCDGEEICEYAGGNSYPCGCEEENADVDYVDVCDCPTDEFAVKVTNINGAIDALAEAFSYVGIPLDWHREELPNGTVWHLLGNLRHQEGECKGSCYLCDQANTEG